MSWLSPSDKALAALAVRIADEIETALDRAREYSELLRDAAGDDPSIYKRVEKLESQCNATKAVGWLGQQLQGVLRDLGGTPGARKELAARKQVGGRLAQIREDAAAGEDDS